MKQLDGGRKYFRIHGVLQLAAIWLEDNDFTTGHQDYLLRDWVEDVEKLIFEAWDKDIADGSR